MRPIYDAQARLHGLLILDQQEQSSRCDHTWFQILVDQHELTGGQARLNLLHSNLVKEAPQGRRLCLLHVDAVIVEVRNSR